LAEHLMGSRHCRRFGWARLDQCRPAVAWCRPGESPPRECPQKVRLPRSPLVASAASLRLRCGLLELFVRRPHAMSQFVDDPTHARHSASPETVPVTYQVSQRAAAPVYLSGIEREFAGRLTDAELAAVHRALRKVLCQPLEIEIDRTQEDR